MISSFSNVVDSYLLHALTLKSLVRFLVLDAVCSQIQLGRRLFEVGVERGFYAKVSRLGEQWFELDLHFLSLGGGEIALGWWFEECLVPYLSDTDKLANVKSISIVTGYGKTRTRGRRHGDDGMRKRCKAMLRFMGITESEQPNLGRIHVDKENLIEVVQKNGGKIIFDLDGYLKWKEAETTANVIPDTQQKIRARFKPTVPGSGRPPFTRVENEFTSDEYRLENQQGRLARLREQDDRSKDEYQAGIDYTSRDGIDSNYKQGMDEPISRLNSKIDYLGRADPSRRGDSNRHNSGSPRDCDYRMGPSDSRCWTDGEPLVNGSAYLQDRPRLFRAPPYEDQAVYSNNSRSSNVPSIVRGSDRDFHSEAPSLSRYDEPPRFTERFSNDIPLLHGDNVERYNEWRGIGRDLYDDRGREALESRHCNASFRDGDRGIASDKGLYPVLQIHPQQFADGYVDRPGPFNVLNGGGRGHGYQLSRSFDDTPFNGVGRSERDSMPHGNHFRHNGRSARGDGDVPRFGSDSLHDSFSDRRDFPRQVLSSRTGLYQGAAQTLTDGGIRNRDYQVGGHPHPYNSIEVNYRTNDRLSDHQEHDLRAFQQGHDHKRHCEVISQPRDANLTLRVSTNSRGYALEPQSQRRRLS
jgi:hypothetical protein